ncbi:MAG: hypothetical protein ABSG13_29935 [Bryobacteraceae bacterium]|jgi:hypothetical protein
MANRTSNIHLLRQRVVESSKRSSPHLIGSKMTESGLLDRAVLNRQIEEILDGLAEKPSLAPRMEQDLEAFLAALQEGDVSRTAKHVCGLLSLQLDDLRKAALLSLMVRLAGKRKFDPIASYILQNREVFVTDQG